MKTIVTAYVAAAVTMLGMDAVWLSISADLLYRPQLGNTLLQEFRPVPPILFYVLYVAGIVIFAIKPALKAGRWSGAVTKGALFGFFCYATYDLTNQATLKTWPASVTIIDMGQGACLTACVATAGYVAASKLGRLG